MAQLIVRNLDPELVVELRPRAAASGRSAEAEHRELLRSALKWTGVSCPCRQVQRGNTK